MRTALRIINSNPGNGLALQLQAQANAGQLRSFASFLTGGKLYQLPQAWDAVPAILR
jgi:hypothetical protein